MRYLIIYVHPNPKSFNHAIRERLETKLKREGKQYDIRDLYELKFDPVLKGDDFIALKQGRALDDVAGEQEHIRRADVLIFIHPIWWFGMPAILKGYIDRVFSFGFAYTADQNGLRGLLNGKKVVIINTTGGSDKDYRDKGFKDALGKTMDIGTFGLCGMDVILHKFFHAVPTISNDAREEMLREIDGLVL